MSTTSHSLTVLLSWQYVVMRGGSSHGSIKQMMTQLKHHHHMALWSWLRCHLCYIRQLYYSKGSKGLLCVTNMVYYIYFFWLSWYLWRCHCNHLTGTMRWFCTVLLPSRLWPHILRAGCQLLSGTLIRDDEEGQWQDFIVFLHLKVLWYNFV